MRKSIFLWTLVLLLHSASEAQAAWVWTPQTRRWINPKYAPKDTPQAQMDWAVGFFEAQDYLRSAKEFLRLVGAYPRSELAPEAQYLAGVSFELTKRLGPAFTAHKRLIEIYPFSPRFQDAVEREFLVGEQLFQGERLRLVGPIKLAGLDKAIEIYEHVVQHAPYGAYGPKARLRLGECFLRERRYEEAQRAFQRVVDDYPTSPLVEEAKFRVAFCARQLSLRPSYDQSATDEAIEWYENFIEAHPDSELISQATESLRQLQEIKAEGLAKIARFYETQRKFASAAFYYREILKLYPESLISAQAVAQLRQLEEKGLLEK